MARRLFKRDSVLADFYCCNPARVKQKTFGVFNSRQEAFGVATPDNQNKNKPRVQQKLVLSYVQIKLKYQNRRETLKQPPQITAAISRVTQTII